MKYNPQDHNRQSIRLKGYDYSQSGAYFITICTYKKQCWLGEIHQGEMVFNQIGKIVAQEWLKSSEIRQEIELDQWIIMPNHLHGIVWIKNPVGAQGLAPLPIPYPKHGAAYRKPKSLASFVSGFKSAVTTRINKIRQTPRIPVWQRNYYESIIRDEKGLNTIREYIIANPQKWSDDPENPQNNGQEVGLILDLPF